MAVNAIMCVFTTIIVDSYKFTTPFTCFMNVSSSLIITTFIQRRKEFTLLKFGPFSDFTQLSRCIAAILYGTPIIDSVSFAKFLFYWNFFLFLFPSVFLLASWFQIPPKQNCLHRRPVFVVSMFTLKAEKNEKANSNNIFWI